ncbi:hypothetical protein [Coleofasciculus sp. FACHB-501]|uniref:hypothetical protein n=1 Tax=Cyanophyceae TaxID=3028117 RepID=UPI001684B4B0|nr:hypothetical protein [Coleofasciculus sp. FACHB-501]MBD1839911.1 hypothetical protein [Coleofasciculus sp. FACHB-501]
MKYINDKCRFATSGKSLPKIYSSQKDAMSEIQTAYKVVALAVWQIAGEEHPDDLAILKRIFRVKAKGKRIQTYFKF